MKMKKLCAWLLVSGMLLQTPGTTASAAIQGQDVESFKSGAQAASMDVDSSQKMDAGKQSETPGWQAETLRNRRKRPEKKGLQENRWQVIRMRRKEKEHCSLRPERWYRKAGCI